MTHPSSNPSSSRDASTVAAASTRRFASRVDGRHTSLGHARKETTTTTTTTTMRGTTTTTVASSSSSSLSSSTLVADARGRRAVSRCAVRRVDARREEPKIQPRRRTGTATTRETSETRERSSRAHRSTHAARHRHRANSVVFETPVATTKQTTRETRPAALGVRSSSRASTRRTDDDARDRRDVDAIARGRRREDENRDAEDASRDDDDGGEDDASFRAAAAARDPAAASRDDARARDRRATPSFLPSDQASLLQEERDALRSAYELVVAERDDARAIRELARNAERDAARRLEASRRRHDARARHLRRAIDVIEHLRHGRATGEDVDDFLRACRRETERNDDETNECLT